MLPNFTSAEAEKAFGVMEAGDRFKFTASMLIIGNENYPIVARVSEIKEPTSRLSNEQIVEIDKYEFKKKGRMFGGNK